MNPHIQEVAPETNEEKPSGKVYDKAKEGQKYTLAGVECILRKISDKDFFFTVKKPGQDLSGLAIGTEHTVNKELRKVHKITNKDFVLRASNKNVPFRGKQNKTKKKPKNKNSIKGIRAGLKSAKMGLGRPVRDVIKEMEENT